MEETSLDNKLLKTNQDDNLSFGESARSLGPDGRNSMSKRSRVYVVLISVSILLIGSGIFVYLLSSYNKICQCSIADGCSINAKPLINNRTTLPLSTGEQTTFSTFISNKLTTKDSVHDGTTTARKQDCHDNWVSYGQSCYFFSNQSVRWLDAMIRCQNLNAYLVEITTADENLFLTRHAEYLNRFYKKDCYKTTSSRYDGNVNTTYNGLTCQRWDSQTPHKHTRNQVNRFPDTSLADAANYCRDPDGEGLPWCYTTDPEIRWKFCEIYQCPGGNYWTGLVTLEDKFTWINTHTILGQGYSNWGKDQPKLSNSYTCGSFTGAKDFQWRMQKCLMPAMYVCEKMKY